MSLKTRYCEKLEDNFVDGLELMLKKNADYAKEGDPFQNFREAAAFAGVTLEQGILVRLSDKLTRYKNLRSRGSEGGEVGENLTDTLFDAMNYLNILKTWHDLGKPEADSEQLEFDFAYEPEILGRVETPTYAPPTNWFVDFMKRVKEAAS